MPEGNSSVASKTIVAATKELGCVEETCGDVAKLVSTLQGNPGEVDLFRLHEAPGVSHQCGFTFPKGGTETTEERIQATMDRLLELADDNGRLDFADLMTVKLEICDANGDEINQAGHIETRLIFILLGGLDRGYVQHSDVDKFFHTEMPDYKTQKWISLELIDTVK